MFLNFLNHIIQAVIKLLSNSKSYFNKINKHSELKDALPLSIQLAMLYVILNNVRITDVSGSIIVSAAVTSLFASTVLTNRQQSGNTNIIYIYIYFVILTIFFTKINRLFSFFLLYELFLLPSSFIVGAYSTSKRAQSTFIHFVTWTQTGSFILFAGIMSIYVLNGSTSFTGINTQRNGLPLIPQLLIILGFLVKVPSFPFYFWLLKTHVESITSFSIFLSGFLVKIAVYGIYKFYTFFSYGPKIFGLVLLIIGGVSASISIAQQTDFKKIVAYTTVQEMSQIVSIVFLMGPTNGSLVGKFIIVHTLISTLFFYISDVLQKIYGTRSTHAIKGVIMSSPKLAILITAAVVFFRGIPFSTKNAVELSIIDLLLSVGISITFVWVLFITLVGNITLTYSTYKLLSFNRLGNLYYSEINKQELQYMGTCMLLLIYINNIKI